MDQWTVGIDIGGTKIEAAHMDIHGVIRKIIRKKTDIAGGPSAVILQIQQAIEELKNHAKSPAIGLGVGMAGQVDSRSGVVHFGPNLNWHEVPLGEELQRKTGLPTIVTNDVRAATLGEWTYGAGRHSNHFICIFVGTGVGGGIVSQGTLLEGGSNTAGEIGHMIVDIDGKECTCGGRGCLETIASGWAIAQAAQEALEASPDKGPILFEMAQREEGKITAFMVQKAFHRGDLLAIEVVEKVVKALAAGVISLVHIINPEQIIFGGGVLQGFPELIPLIEKKVRAGALSAATRSLVFLPAELEKSGVIGAATLAFKNFT